MENSIRTATIPLEEYTELINFKDVVMKKDRIVFFYTSYIDDEGKSPSCRFISNDDAIISAKKINDRLLDENKKLRKMIDTSKPPTVPQRYIDDQIISIFMNSENTKHFVKKYIRRRPFAMVEFKHLMKMFAKLNGEHLK